jgi:hypothetical protein
MFSTHRISVFALEDLAGKRAAARRVDAIGFAVPFDPEKNAEQDCKVVGPGDLVKKWPIREIGNVRPAHMPSQ